MAVVEAEIQQQPAGEDDDRVEVQLVVMGIAVFVVVVVGTGAYLLRRQLGLIPPSPGEGGDAGHEGGGH